MKNLLSCNKYIICSQLKFHAPIEPCIFYKPQDFKSHVYINFSVPCPEIMGNRLKQSFGSMKIHRNPLLFLFMNMGNMLLKHTLKLKNISKYYYLQKTSMSTLKHQKVSRPCQGFGSHLDEQATACEITVFVS